ncbi:MAG: Asp-tRNA(Asn)/Glu-tRNA(Gln) amidotransferase subunit GatA [Silvanigrellales bacterium]|nr:Asp-tRNA(Asn)/Glu-tRNA(Gln) amidotransferase subunit GatA [Silvanigrellales bacterium]
MSSPPVSERFAPHLAQICFHSASSLASHFSSSPHSMLSYFESLMSSVEQRNPAVNALTSVQKEATLERVQRLASRGPQEGETLFGVPIILKENIQKVGFPVQCASRILEGYRGQFDATAVERLERAGAVLYATANMDEFAMGSSNENSVHGPVRNPYDLSRVSGGSSGGSAVACALGFAPVTLGSDTGGSVRQPASYCGVYGFKPSYGRVSRYGLVAYGSSLDQISPYARTAADLDIVLQVMAGEDPRDATTLREPYVSHWGRLRLDGVRVGIPRGLVSHARESGKLHPSVARALDKMEAELRAAGAKVIDVEISGIDVALPAYYLIACAEASSNLSRFDGIRFGRRAHEKNLDLAALYARSRAEGFGDEVKRRIMLGTFALSEGYAEAYYGRAQAAREALASGFKEAFQTVDVLLTPTAPTPAFELGRVEDDPTRVYFNDIFTIPANLARLCAVSVPAPLALTEFLPVGLQFCAPQGKDAWLVDLVRCLEEHSLCEMRCPPDACTVPALPNPLSAGGLV